MSAFNNEERARQLIDFDGMRWGRKRNILPTDVDACLEFRDTLWVFTEYKVRGTPRGRGQMTFYQRTVDALGAAGKNAVILYATHRTPLGRNVNGAKARVEAIYFQLQKDDARPANGQWFSLAKPLPAKEAIDVFMSLSGLGNLI